MDIAALDKLFEPGALELPHLWDLFLRMAVATALGACIAYRVWRRLMPWLSAPAIQGAESQTLIAAAGALMVVVIGDEPARAFGLVGLGSFIRFRSGISDPRDAAVMFVMIGIGMACGLGLLLMALGATVFVCLILMVFDWKARALSKRVLVTFNAEDPVTVREHLSAAFPSMRVIEIGKNLPELGKDSGKLIVELDLESDACAATLRERLESRGVPGIRRLAFDQDD